VVKTGPCQAESTPIPLSQHLPTKQVGMLVLTRPFLRKCWGHLLRDHFVPRHSDLLFYRAGKERMERRREGVSLRDFHFLELSALKVHL